MLYLLYRSLRCLTAIAAFSCFLACHTSAAKEQDPENLVNKLGGSSYKEREQAMKSLSALGYKARNAVQAALRSPDPEIQSRATELWKSLRWLVSSNITTEALQPLLCYSNKISTVDYCYYQRRAVIDPFEYSSAYYPTATDNIDSESWKSFIGKNQGNTLLLLVELNKDPSYQSTFRGAMRLCIDTLGPDIIARDIEAADEKIRKEFVTMFTELVIPYSANSNTYANAVAIYNKLGMYEKAFESGQAWYQLWPQEGILDQCAYAAKKGKMEEKVWKKAAAQQFPANDSRYTSCAWLAFHAGLARKLETPAVFSSLKKPPNISFHDRRFVQSLFQSMLDMKLYDDLKSISANSSDPVVLYFKSMCYKAQGKEKEAENEWQNACRTVETIPNKEAAMASCYAFADFLENRNDKEAEKLWQKVLETSTSNSVYHANTCFRLARHAERKEDLAAAADLYERGLSSSRVSGGVIAASFGIDNKVMTEDDIRKRIAGLREKQSQKKK